MCKLTPMKTANKERRCCLRAELLLIVLLLTPVAGEAKECVVLLHGLARTAGSMEPLAEALGEAGYYVANIDYPSRHKPVAELAGIAVTAGMRRCRENEAVPVNFVTHSLGGILVRYYFERHEPARVDRVVMLAPPNQGSEVVDKLKDMPGFELWNGPAGMQLGTGTEDIPAHLGPVNFETGVIAGTQSINLILSTFLPNPDDGKVSAERTRVEGMCAFITLPVTHTFMMGDDEVFEQVLHFLREGRFDGKSAENLCNGD